MSGVELRRVRRRLGLTQVALAGRLAVTPTTVARWERGERRITPAMERLVRLAAAEARKGKGSAR